MGLFDKKYCDICGEKIGFLGNRKLEDGNLCRDCAAKLSPFFSDRRNSTIEEIKAQLAYREENRQRLADFSPTITFDGSMKVYIDPEHEQFIVTRLSDWQSGNPDLISFSQVRGVDHDIRENKEEIYYEDSDGNEKSYEPPRYRYDYEFNVKIWVDSPWFDEIELELSDGNRPESRYSDLYHEYEQKMIELEDILIHREDRHASYDGIGYYNISPNQPEPSPESEPPEVNKEAWICPSCGAQNSGKFCVECGSERPSANVIHCSSCGSDIEYQIKPPKFCPECGSPLQ